jgi:hypothetical protein
VLPVALLDVLLIAACFAAVTRSKFLRDKSAIAKVVPGSFVAMLGPAPKHASTRDALHHPLALVTGDEAPTQELRWVDILAYGRSHPSEVAERGGTGGAAIADAVTEDLPELDLSRWLDEESRQLDGIHREACAALSHSLDLWDAEGEHTWELGLSAVLPQRRGIASGRWLRPVRADDAGTLDSTFDQIVGVTQELWAAELAQARRRCESATERLVAGVDTELAWARERLDAEEIIGRSAAWRLLGEASDLVDIAEREEASYLGRRRAAAWRSSLARAQSLESVFDLVLAAPGGLQLVSEALAQAAHYRQELLVGSSDVTQTASAFADRMRTELTDELTGARTELQDRARHRLAELEPSAIVHASTAASA